MTRSYCIAFLQFFNRYQHSTIKKLPQSFSPPHSHTNLLPNCNIIHDNLTIGTNLKYKCRSYISYLMSGLTINLN